MEEQNLSNDIHEYNDRTGVLKKIVTGCDIVLEVLCFLGVYHFYNEVSPGVNTGVDLQVYLTIVVLSYVFLAYYIPPILFERVVQVDKLIQRAFYKSLLLLFVISAVLFLMKSVAIARFLLATFTFLFFWVLVLQRIFFRHLVKAFRRRGRNQQHVILVGNGDELDGLYMHMQRGEYGYHVLGYFSDNANSSLYDLERKGELNDVIPFLEHHPKVNALYCSMTYNKREEILNIYRYCENHVIRFYALPMYLKYLRKNMTVSYIGHTILLTPRPEPLRDMGNRILKRSLDIVVSLVVLLTIYPIVYLIVLFVTKRQSPGPVYFKQNRSGLNGKTFICYKFRSMHVNSESDNVQATPDDPRKFPFGDFMRRANIDELPQFINVLFGNMSLVGPRPHMLAHTEQYRQIVNRYMVRHWVKPGITGWAQINGFRGETHDVSLMEERVKHDIWYVENWNFWLDIRILWKTFWNTIFHTEMNAY